MLLWSSHIVDSFQCSEFSLAADEPRQRFARFGETDQLHACHGLVFGDFGQRGGIGFIVQVQYGNGVTAGAVADRALLSFPVALIIQFATCPFRRKA